LKTIEILGEASRILDALARINGCGSTGAAA